MAPWMQRIVDELSFRRKPAAQPKEPTMERPPAPGMPPPPSGPAVHAPSYAERQAALAAISKADPDKLYTLWRNVPAHMQAAVYRVFWRNLAFRGLVLEETFNGDQDAENEWRQRWANSGSTGSFDAVSGRWTDTGTLQQAQAIPGWDYKAL